MPRLLAASTLVPLLAGMVALVGCTSSPSTPDADTFSPADGAVVIRLAGVASQPTRSGDCDYLTHRSLTGKKVTITDAERRIVALAALVDTGGQDLEWQERKLPLNTQTILSGTCVWEFEIPPFDSESEYFSVTVDGIPDSLDVTRAELERGLSLTTSAGRP